MPKPRIAKPGTFEELGTFEGDGIAPRRVQLYLPPHPPGGMARPALVLFDGQNVFGDEGSYAGGWWSHLAVDRLVLTRSAVAPIIIAIDHGNAARIDELGPWREGNKGGKADALLDVIEHRILPAARERVAMGSVVVGGSSMGGLCALYAHLSRPDVFAGALAMSPSIWFGRKRIFDLADDTTAERSAIYLDAGALEMRGVLLALCHAFGDRLERKGWSDHGEKSLLFRPDTKGTHSEVCWRRRLPKALRFLFGF